MTDRTWGYAGQVGEWLGTLAIPNELRKNPSAAIRWVIDQVIPIFEPLHRPRKMLISWAEFDELQSEVGFHELEELKAEGWDAITANLSRLEAQARGTFALSCLFITLDTSVVEGADISWLDSSAELQISIPAPELEPEVAALHYSMSIDVWLTKTYGEDNSLRANEAAAARNRPRLESVLKAFSELVGESFRVGESQYYHDVITSTGFRDR